MNKKTRIKTTLDSLFTGGKYSSGEPAAMPLEPVKKSKPPKQAKKTKSPELVQDEIAKKPEQPKQELIESVRTVVPVEKPIEAVLAQPVTVTKEELPIREGLETLVEKTELPQEKTIEPVTPSSVPEMKNTEELVQKMAKNIDRASQIQNGDDEQLVIFMLSKETYGVNIHAVESIIKLQTITEVPRSAAFILGVTNLRGTVVPVLDLRKRFNMCPCENSINSRIIIVNAEGSKVGILVDEVDEVLKVSRDAIQPPPAMATTIDSTFINGIARIEDRLIILLDLEKVLISSTRQHHR
jgi:purine-binding chemotaxis protein CheW